MLADWYFCCCIATSFQRTRVFLAILDMLDSGGRHRALTHYAYRELKNTDSWMQIYALPRVLATLGSTDIEKPHAALREYLGDLVDVVPNKSKKSFRDLVDLILASSGNAVLVQALRRCAETLELDDMRPTADVPYLDLRDFLAETFLLATMAEALADDPGFATYLKEFVVGDDEEQPLSRLLLCGVNGQLGRLAFLLSVRIARYFPDYVLFGQRTLLQHIWDNERHNPELEPDLLALSAEVAFLDPLAGQDETTRQAQVNALVQESLRFGQFRRMRQSVPPRRRAQREARSRVGMTAACVNRRPRLHIDLQQSYARIVGNRAQIHPSTANRP